MFEAFPEAKKWILGTPSWAIRNQHFYEKMGFVKVRETEVDPHLGWSGIEYELEVRDWKLENRPGRSGCVGCGVACGSNGPFPASPIDSGLRVDQSDWFSLEAPLYFGALGAVIVLFGMVVLVRFLRGYPRAGKFGQ
jgi:hypothetical protein